MSPSTSSESPETEEGFKLRHEKGLVTEWEVAGCVGPWQSSRIHQVPSRKKGLQRQLNPRAQTLSPRLGHAEQRHLLRGADAFFLKNVKVKIKNWSLGRTVRKCAQVFVLFGC